MWQTLKKLFIVWFKSLFRGNMLVEQPAESFEKLAYSLQVGILGAVTVVGFGFVLFTVLVIGVIKDWF